LWPDLSSDKASISFHQTLKRLRDSVLGENDYIVVQDDYYRVNPRYLEWCDVLAFEQLYERLATATGEESLTLQLELMALYRGEFLAGFELGEWGTAYRSSCEVRFLQIARLAGQQLLDGGAPREALMVIQKGLAEDYFREDLHYYALKAYAQLGLHERLATHYAELRDTFEREFDVPPDSLTEQLVQQLIAEE
jgi:two-component SAPR family response regulator